MRLVRLMILVVLAAVITAEPVVHTHPLNSQRTESNDLTTPNVCAICAIGADRVIVDGPSVAAPQVVVERLGSLAVAPPSFEAPLPRASRAPPAA